jgi:broad specificity phosphatase PhoE
MKKSIVLLYCLFILTSLEAKEACRVVLVRHGETEWNVIKKSQGWRDIPLNERGIEQSNILAKAFADLPIQCVYCSALSRAEETARIIAKPHEASIVSDPAIRFYRRNKKVEIPWFLSKKTKGKLIEKEVAADAMAYLQDLAKKHPGQTVVMVTHQLVLQSLRNKLDPQKTKQERLANGKVLYAIATEEGVVLEDQKTWKEQSLSAAGSEH